MKFLCLMLASLLLLGGPAAALAGTGAHEAVADCAERHHGEAEHGVHAGHGDPDHAHPDCGDALFCQCAVSPCHAPGTAMAAAAAPAAPGAHSNGAPAMPSRDEVRPAPPDDLLRPPIPA